MEAAYAAGKVVTFTEQGLDYRGVILSSRVVKTKYTGDVLAYKVKLDTGKEMEISHRRIETAASKGKKETQAILEATAPAEPTEEPKKKGRGRGRKKLGK